MWQTILSIINNLLSFVNTKRQYNFREVIYDSRRVSYILNNLLKQTNADRIIILVSHNGGGKPALGKQLKSSARFEVVNPNSTIEPLLTQWQNQMLDNYYNILLARLLAEGEVSLVTKNMPEGILKDSYLAQGIVESTVYLLHERKDSIVYMSFNHTKPKSKDPKVVENKRRGINELSNLFSKYKGDF